MASQLMFTCVPAGIKNGRASLDVLVTPQFDAQTDVSAMIDWSRKLRDNKENFKVSINGTLSPLQLDTTPIVDGLWEKIFDVANQPPFRVANAQNTLIQVSKAAVSLSSSHKRIRSFYQETLLSRKKNSKKLGPDAEFLRKLHREAIQQNGLYSDTEESAPHPEALHLKSDRSATYSASRLPKFSSSSSSSAKALLVADRLGLPSPVDRQLSAIHNAFALPTAAACGVNHLLDVIHEVSVPSSTPSLTVTSTAVPPFTVVGTNFSVTFSASGGSGPYNWTSTELPSGLSLNAGGVLSGSPMQAGSFQPQITVTDVTGVTASFHLLITVVPRVALTIVTTDLPKGVPNAPYWANLYATGIAPFKWTVNALPDWLSLDSDTGILSGVPRTAGSPKITIQVADASNSAAVATVLQIVVEDSSVTVPTGDLPTGSINSPYANVKLPMSGKAGYRWNIISGKLHHGLSLDSNQGIISGTPSQAGASKLRLQITNPQASSFLVFDLSLTILQRRDVIVSSLPAGITGTPYSASVVDDTTTPCSWSATNLPAGLNLDPATGILSGTPSVPTFVSGKVVPQSVTITAVDSNGVFADQASVDVSIYPTAPVLPLQLLPPPQGQLGYFYSTQLAVNGTNPQWTAVGTLPPGWSLDPTGILTGNPSTAGTFNFQVQVVSGSTTAKMTVSLFIAQHLLEHVNRLSSVGRGKAAGNLLSHGQATRGSNNTMDFNQRITLLMNMPAIMEGLGLVLHFTFDPPGVALDGALVQLGLPAAGWLPSGLSVSPSLPCCQTVSGADFWPKPNPNNAPQQILPNGWINTADGYGIGCLQTDAEASKMVQFACYAGFRKAAHQKDKAATDIDPSLVISYDEDVVHSVLPRSPVTGGVQVWQDNRQQRMADRIITAQSTNATPTANPLYADDLLNSIAVDILRQDTNEWYHLTERTEHYRIDDIHIDTTSHDRGVRTSATARKDNSAGTFDVDEMIFSWRLNSLVAPPQVQSTKKPKRSSGKTSSQQLPWTNFSAKYTPAKVPSPLFGVEYTVAMRPVYMTGSVLDFDPTKANPQNTLTIRFQRYELILGPDVLPANFADHQMVKQETKTLLIVASELKENLKPHSYTSSSIRVLVPSQVSPDIARRHGKPEDQIKTGATVFPLNNGNLPTKITTGSNDETVGSNAYLPDPLCTGARFWLTDLNNNILCTTDPVDYFDDDTSWPNYIVHLIELQRAESGANPTLTNEIPAVVPSLFPFLSGRSRKIVCHVPPGMTILLVIQPQLDPKVVTQHALSAMTSEGLQPKPDDLSSTDICRPTILRMTHAVDRPIKASTIELLDAIAVPPPQTTPAAPPANYSFTRTPANTFPLTVNADPMSTAKVEVVASWIDQVDDVRFGKSKITSANAHLADFSIAKKSSAAPPAQNVRLPFADSRYRRLAMTAKAYSRLADAFGHSSNALPTTDSAVNAYLVDFLATKPPEAPDVEAVIPNLRWSVDKKKRTRTMGVTVILNRPWFSSGNDERLAVVSSARINGDKSVDSVLRTTDTATNENTTSAWGFMADWQSAGQAYFTVPAGGALPDDSIKLAADDNTDQNDPLDTQPDLEGDVTIGTTKYHAAFFKPRYNEQDQQWYVNISCDKPPAYGAVMRLIVARHQKHAMPGCHLSPLTVCDFVLLNPERYVTIQRSGWFVRTITLKVCGVGAYDNGNLSTTIEVFRTQNKRTDFDWDAETPISPDPTVKLNNGVLWQGKFKEDFLDGATIVIRESESYSAAEPPNANQRRYVYIDAFRL
jgi:hypothetical protein